MSLLPEVSSLTAILLAVNLAYLRLERFQYRTAIRRYAVQTFSDLTREGREIPGSYRNTTDYKLIASLAGKGPQGEGQGRMDKFYGAGWDRGFSLVMVCIAFFLLALGAAHSTGQMDWLEACFTEERILWTFWPVVFVTAISILFVLVGDKYVASAERKIDNAAKAFNEYLTAGASQASIGDAEVSDPKTGSDA